MLTTEEVYALSHFKGIGNKSIKTIVEQCRLRGWKSISDTNFLYFLADKRISRTKKPILAFIGNIDDECLKAKKAITDYKDQGVDVITLADSRYPESLRAIDDAPITLYCRGNLALLNTPCSAAVIGTRENSSLGATITSRTTRWLVQNDAVIISGLALGIDSVAHQTCLDNQGSTVAAVVDVVKISPATNAALADAILVAGGLLISENKPHTPIFALHFTLRNRLIAALANTCIAVEFSEQSGTAQTIKKARCYDKKVFVPNPDAIRLNDDGFIREFIADNKLDAFTKINYPSIAQAACAPVSKK